MEKQKKIFCLEYKNNIPILVEKKNIEIEPLDVISKFKEKFTKKDLVVQQEKILLSLDNKILKIKEVLVYLSSGLLDLNVDNYSFYDKFVNEVISDCADYDQYCTDIAEKLSEEFKFLGINNLLELDSSSIPNHKKILYTFFEKRYSFINNPKRRKIGFRHIDNPINIFLMIFEILLKVKDIFIMFFNILVSNTSTNIKERTLINNFFLQYEFIVSLDVSEHLTRYSGRSSLFNDCVDTYYAHFPSYITQMTKNVLNDIFISTSQCLLKEPNCMPFYVFLETTHKEIIVKEHLYRFLIDNYTNCIFIQYNSTSNTYSYFYDDCIIDFDYVSNMVDGLEYTYYMSQYFISNFLDVYH
jgi:hypothetical protein